ncbi:MAG: nuclear transport factor 2 family protein [Saprospiraceae bacterium]
MEQFSVRDQLIEVVHKLFIYTDEQEWEKLQNEVFTKEIWFDMSSLGAEAKTMQAKEVCDMWQSGFAGIDAVNHLSGNHLVTINGAEADVFTYATATHYKKAAQQGNTRTFVGTYALHLLQTQHGWRINAFQYNLKYMEGNLEWK